MKNIFLSLLALACSCVLTAQDKWQFGLSIGKANYLGDLVEPSFTFDQGTLAGGVHLRYQLLKNVNLRSNMLVTKLQGDDANYEANAARMIRFETSLVEFSLLGEYDLFHLNGKAQGAFTEKFSPYIFGGLGFGLINPEPVYGTDSDAIAADKSAQFSDIQPIVPLGAGLKYNVAKNLILGLEMGMRFSFTDYLDGVSQAGNPDKKDHYLSWGITAAYQLASNDADLDGIADRKDKCPDLPGPEKFNGCPDTDGDGITDAADDCPTEAGKSLLKGCPDSDDDGVPDHADDCPEAAGIRRLGGCPDSDGDGIVDPEDLCPKEAGIPSLNGCPDADRDGITDAKDECPLEAGSMQLLGCPDSDSDGVPDKIDKCPNLPGKPANKGCPDLDTDQDGIFDHKDKCPEQAGPADNAGCPVIQQEDQAVLDLAMSNVEFETGSASLLPSSFLVLDQVVGIMQKYKGYRLYINGHTDNVGSPQDNQVLSEQRALACYSYLSDQGVTPAMMAYKGFGSSQPLAENETEQGRKRNRRVEFVLSVE